MDLNEALDLLTADDPRQRRIWNERRRQSEPVPPLSGQDFSGHDLSWYDLRGLDLSWSELRSCSLFGTQFGWANLHGTDLTGADARGADFFGADCEEIVLVATQLENATGLGGRDLRTAEIRDIEAGHVDLSDARLDGDGIDLTGCDLTRAKLDGATLSSVRVRDAILVEASFVNAVMPGADLVGARATDAVFWDSDGRNSALRSGENDEATEITGVSVAQYAGAALSGVALPSLLLEFKDAFATIQRASDYMRKIHFALLLGCAYTLLMLSTTTTMELFSNSKKATLPIINSPIVLTSFFAVSPMVLALTSIYLQLGLRTMWLRVSQLPAVLPDGRDLDRAIDPWLLLGIIRHYFPRLKSNGEAWFERLQFVISVVLAWFAVPITVALCWFFTLPAHDAFASWVQLGALVAATAMAIWSFLEARWILTGGARTRPRDSKETHSRLGPQPRAPLTWLGVALVLAALAVQIESIHRDNPPGFLRVSFEGRDLSGADMRDAYLAHARLAGTLLSRARLGQANLTHADLRGADLSAADLTDAILDGADLNGADLTCARLTNAGGLDCDALGTAIGVELAWGSGTGCTEIIHAAKPPSCADRARSSGSTAQTGSSEAPCCGPDLDQPERIIRVSGGKGSNRASWLSWAFVALAFGGLAVAAAASSNAGRSRMVVAGTMSLLSGATATLGLLDHVELHELVFYDASSHEYHESVAVDLASRTLQPIGTINGFASGEATLREGTTAISTMRALVDEIASSDHACIVLVGRTSRQPIGAELLGRYDSNAELAHARADWIRQRLEERLLLGHRVPILTLVGGAERRESDPSDDLAAANRRVDAFGCP